MATEYDFVRYEPIPGDRYKVVIGHSRDEVIVAELAIGPAEELVVNLRRVLGGYIDLVIQNTHHRHRADREDLDEALAEAGKDAQEDALDAVDSYIKLRAAAAPKRPFGKCCRATANDIKTSLRGRR